MIASVADRVVLRAILDTCQSDSPRLRAALGDIPRFLATKTSVGGVPGKGVETAIHLVSAAIEGGARWFVRSDIKDFFTKIPRPEVKRLLSQSVTDRAFLHMLMAGLEVALSNVEELGDDIDLFPRGPIGVPQGSALSALCANIILSNFDQRLNGRNITTVRYVDDFVILGPTKKATELVWNEAERMLREFNMCAHDPSKITKKASKGEIKNGFDFLSVHFSDKEIAPTSDAKRSIIAKLRLTIREAKKDIIFLRNGQRRDDDAYIQSLVLLDRQIRGWGDAYRATTQRVVFHQLDNEIEKILSKYQKWFDSVTHDTSAPAKRRLLGIALLQDAPLLSLLEEEGCGGGDEGRRNTSAAAAVGFCATSIVA